VPDQGGTSDTPKPIRSNPRTILMKSQCSPRFSRDLRSGQFSRRASIIHLCLSGTVILSTAAHAAISTWDGGNPSFDNNWSAVDNWAADVAPVSGDDLVFGGTNLTACNNDLLTDVGGTFTVNSIVFSAGADPFVLEGTAINLNNKTIRNDSTNLQTVALVLKETGNGFKVDGSGDLALENINTSTNSKTITKDGTGTVTVSNRNNSFRITQNNGTIDWAESSGNGLANTNTINGGTLKLTGASSPTHFNATFSLANTNGATATSPATLSLGSSMATKFGILNGAAGSVINSLGESGQTATLRLRSTNNGTTGFAGSLQDSAAGGKLKLDLLNENATQTFTFSGANTHTGGTVVAATATLNLTSSGSLRFLPEPGGVCNKVSGAGSATFNGLFNIDLSLVAGAVDGDIWTLVDAGTLTETYGATFSVASPFSETSPGFWTYDTGSGVFTFSGATGQLTFGRIAVTAWDGGASPDANWSNNTNWDQNLVSNDLIVFAGTTQTTNVNDLDTDYDAGTSTPGTFAVGGLRFDAGAGAYTLQGNAIDFSGKSITNNSTSTQTLELPLQFDHAVGGLTVDAAGGDVVVNSLGLRNGFGTAITKTGSKKLVINGPLVGSDTFSLALNSGSMEVNTNGNLFFGGTIAAGATLTTGGTSPGGVLHNGASYTVNGTLDLAQSVQEDVGSFLGSGTITNHGSGGTTGTIVTRSTVSRTFSGSIKDGPAGGTSALQVGAAGGTETGVLTLSGANTYSGDTTLGQTEASLLLSGTGSLLFNPAAAGVTNRITATAPQVTGTVQLDGRFFVDLSGAAVANGNSWPLVDVANLNETFGPTFQIVNSAYVPATTYLINSGTGTFGFFGEDDALATGGSNYSNTNTIDMSAVTNPAPQEVYQSERAGNFTYNFTGLGAGASYKIRLHFAEIYHSAAGARMFNVLINGATVLSNFDVLAAAGAKNKAIVQEFTVPANLGGSIAVQFVTVTDNAKVSGIEIEPVGGPSGSTFTEAADVWTMVDGANTWTFSEATGVLSLSTGGGATYASWASANGIAGQPASGDFDNDGLSNLIEYALGKSPTSSSVPAGSYASGTVSFSKGVEAVANGDVTWVIEESDDLGATDAWQTVTPTVNNPSTISYTLPTGKPRVFVRLAVEQP
jgi:hypothetical protein